jgi:translation initiation factor 4B
MRADAAPAAASPDASAPSSPQVAQAPKERPRLNLTKRTVSEQKPDAPPAEAPKSKASPFGAARPTDTAQRDREMAEKREAALREKREADEKAKEEKAAKDAAAKKERAEKGEQDGNSDSASGARRTSRQQNGPPKSNPWRQNGEQSDKNVSILKREESAEKEAQRDTPDGDANGDIVADKETKPQEVVREVTRDAGEGAKAETTAEVLEDDGWSTVPAKGPKNSRRGGARAMAS